MNYVWAGRRDPPFRPFPCQDTRYWMKHNPAGSTLLSTEGKNFVISFPLSFPLILLSCYNSSLHRGASGSIPVWHVLCFIMFHEI